MEARGVERDTITYSAAISACEKGGQWEHALRLHEEMEARGVKRNTITYSAAISACEQVRHFTQALRLFQLGLSDGSFRSCTRVDGRLLLDLHHLSCSVSRVAIASLLEQMRGGVLPLQDIAIVTGALAKQRQCMRMHPRPTLPDFGLDARARCKAGVKRC
jgi:pentatricopeptide repeat protein